MLPRKAAFDIEIVQDPAAVQYIPEKGPKDRSEPWDKLKFDSNYNIICCASICDEYGDVWSNIVKANDFYDEKDLLQDIWDNLKEYDVIITFNGSTFDLPFLYRRSWYHNVMPSRRFSLKKYVSPDDPYLNHIDLRGFLSNWNSYAHGSLDLFCRLKLGQGKEDGMSGEQVQGMWDAGKYEEIRKYCEDDARLTMELYRSMQGYYL